MKRIVITSLFLLSVGGISAVVHWQLYLPEECRGAPKTVPFRQGMTLCPGQSATFTITP